MNTGETVNRNCQQRSKGRGAKKYCVFGTCNSDSRKADSDQYSFVRFPKPCINVRAFRTQATPQHISMCNLCNKCDNWIKNCLRGDGRFEKVEDAIGDRFICSKHFVKKELLQKYPSPLPEELVLMLNEGDQGVPQMVLLQTEVEKDPLANIAGRNRKRLQPSLTLIEAGKRKKIEVDTDVAAKASNTEERSRPTCSSMFPGQLCEFPPNCKSSRSTQTTFKVADVEKLKNKVKQLEDENKMLREKVKKLEGRKGSVVFSDFVESLQEDGKKCRFYTGMSFVQILAVFNFLRLDGTNINYWGENNSKSKLVYRKKLTCRDELILTLVRLRSGLLVRDLKYRFSISEAVISNTVTTMIQCMLNRFSLIRPFMFPSREKVKKHLPKLFSKLTNIRVIIDCAEFYCQSPRFFEHQGNLYSEYKAHTTFKVLIGCTPNGVVSFISDLFEGSISDKQLVVASKLMNLLEEGDLVLADRGFTIQDLANKKRVTVNIPAFLKGRERLTAEEERATKDIASKRIYIEHVVGKLKQYRLLKKVLPLSMRGILSQTVFVCACLMNFQPPILK